MELTSARVGGVSYPAGAIQYQGQGNWNRLQGTTTVGSGTFTLHFTSGQLPGTAIFTLKNVYSNSPYPNSTIYLQTQDGVHFNAQIIPSIQPTPPEINLTVQNGSVTGLMSYSAEEGNPPATVNYTVQIIGTYAAVP